ncbi:MAG: class I SAM-dependent methyltransferase [Candidatus Nanopelagicales bacterium]
MNKGGLDSTVCKYEGEIDLSVKNNSHTLAYDLIMADCKGKARILEVGCATGYFGKVLKEAGHEVWGVELNPVAALEAERWLDQVYVGSIQAFLANPGKTHLQFDYIVFGDVLEHLVDPQAILLACHTILKPAGAIVASIPNIAHLAVRVMLLEGRWEYANLGILDNTHLRFFDKRAVIRLFNDTGYFIKSLAGTRVSVADAGIPINLTLLKKAKKLISGPEIEIFQYIVLAKSAEASCIATQSLDWAAIPLLTENERIKAKHGVWQRIKRSAYLLLSVETWRAVILHLRTKGLRSILKRGKEVLSILVKQ